MALPLDDLQHFLLDLISTHRQVDGDRALQLGKDDWEVVLSMVRQHRLAPLLHWRLTHERSDVPVPEDIRGALADSFRKAALRALVMQRELLLLVRILGKAGIPCIALKGAYLAYTVYPHPALRPLRDLDVLVAKDKALDAYQALIDGGYRRPREYSGDPQAWMSVCQHLPPLQSSSGQVMVELHTRLIVPNGMHAMSVDNSGLWKRRVERRVAGESLAHLSPTDLLLYLILHAVYRHRFDNGPLTLSDLSYLIRGTEIDWPLFWRLADEGGWTRGCLLLLKMTQRYFGGMPIDFPNFALSELEGVDALVATCSSLTLTDFKSRGDARLVGALAGKFIHQKLSVLLGKVFPPKAQIAASYPVSDNSLGIYFGYLSNGARILSKRVPEFLASRRSGAFRNGARKMAELDRWLMRS